MKQRARRKIRNRPGKAPINVFPTGDTLDLEKLDRAGVRIAVERALERLHGYGDDMWREIGHDKRQLTRYRAKIVDVLRNITLDSKASRTTRRSAAAALLGEVGGSDVLPDLAWVLESENENVSMRGWAAAAMARLGGDKAAMALKPSLANPSPVIRRQVVEALAQTRSKVAVQALREMATRDEDPTVAASALSGARTLEKILGLRLAPLRLPGMRARKRKGKTSPPAPL